MKKIALLFLCAVISLSVFAGCNKPDNKDGYPEGGVVIDGGNGSGRTPVDPISDGGTHTPQ